MSLKAQNSSPRPELWKNGWSEFQGQWVAINLVEVKTLINGIIFIISFYSEERGQIIYIKL